jgi:hypothetical protein
VDVEGGDDPRPMRYSGQMGEANTTCPVCKLPIGESKHICHLCKANGRDVRFDSGPCEAEHLTKAHTAEEIDQFDAARTISKD